ncbi:polyketide synthase dehydratase domain-containing protein, partial [Nonomuraea sp. NPDC048916]|uniref:polyketide synthase dehydratase domain-containing protein n=1 Tax=Nonomuraea sp. NPDC048916 TaxID=3154232 RepID=UPI0033F78A33
MSPCASWSAPTTAPDVAPSKSPRAPRPPDATPLDLTGAYERLVELGYGYGPVFRGLRAAWRRGDEVFAEVGLPEGVGEGFGLHPALLDAAMHGDVADDQTLVPFEWRGVSLYSAGATDLRVRIRTGAVSAIEAVDGVGRPVVSVESLVSRPVVGGVLRGSVDGLWRVEWGLLPVPVPVPVPTLVSGAVSGSGSGSVPVRVVRCSVGGGDVVGGVGVVCSEVLGVVQGHVAVEGSGWLVVVTGGAVCVAGDVGVDVVQAPVWGLVRAAQEEFPGRVVLVDSDGSVESESLLGGVVGWGESEVALRGGRVFVP